MDALESLRQENLVLKERLYACHATGLPEVQAAVQAHLNLLDLNVYDHRARLQGQVSQLRTALQGAEADKDGLQNQVQVQDAILGRLRALAVDLWSQLHDPRVEPFPEV